MISAIGVDFDNTIVCYDDIFHRVALEKGLIPTDIEKSKESVRDYLRGVDREDDWTELQGYVYGARMQDVDPYPGVIEFFKTAVESGTIIYIISHKTRHPYRGPKYDLCKAAYEWLELQGFFDKAGIGLDRERVFFNETKEMKLGKIAETGCSHFIDDLPEFLLEENFPEGTERLNFYPALKSDAPKVGGLLRRFTSWDEIRSYFFDPTSTSSGA